MIRHKTLREAYRDGAQYLTACGIEDASVDAWLLLTYVTGITRTYFLAEGGAPMMPEQHARYEELILSRGSHIPLQHLTGQQEFMGLLFRVNEHVLIPRQDTEILVEETLARLRAWHIGERHSSYFRTGACCCSRECGLSGGCCKAIAQ